jgi:hypothetical protein
MYVIRAQALLPTRFGSPTRHTLRRHTPEYLLGQEKSEQQFNKVDLVG